MTAVKNGGGDGGTGSAITGRGGGSSPSAPGRAMDGPVPGGSTRDGGAGATTDPAGSQPDAMAGPPPTRNGGRCETDMGCGSGHCVMNVCCATTCDKDLPESCGLTGTCDEMTGTCKKYGKETTCLHESCSAGTGSYSAPVFCDGSGACPTATRTTTSCKGAPCDGSHCQMGCGAGSNCAPGNFCNGGTCALVKDIAASCSSDSECASGSCADGVCCDKACTGKCFSCLAKFTNSPTGTCAAVAAGTVTDDCAPAPTSGPDVCGNTGACDGNGGCQQRGSETACSQPGCVGGREVGVGTCSGRGSCSPPPTLKNCAFGCQGDVCRPCSPRQNDLCNVTECSEGKIDCNDHCVSRHVNDDQPCSGGVIGGCRLCRGGSCQKLDSLCFGHNKCRSSGRCEVAAGGACDAVGDHCPVPTSCLPLQDCTCDDGTPHPGLASCGVGTTTCGMGHLCSMCAESTKRTCR